tara:strand:+ start:395 stop:721 length:327 start_codon:yes stop_codon:yes gene_type:complete
MSNLKETVAVLLEGKVGELDPKSADPTDPTVQIRGFGTMLLSQLKKDVERKLEDLVKRAKRDDFAIAAHELTKSGGVLPHKLTAIMDAEEAMSKGPWKTRITKFKSKR